MIETLIICFVLTMIIEFIIVKLFFIKEPILLYVFLANVLTNPCVVYIYNMMSMFSLKSKDIVLFIMEILVAIVEGICYKYMLKISFKKAFLVSLVANAVAYVVGIII